ncbi:hypothetical protein CLAFUR0_06998 [Fulvia fulva]|nr:hypothetical protein CLAFUR0_06998 [Fulvia fulva]
MGAQRTCGRPSLEEHFTAYMKTKHAAQHIEHTSEQKPVDTASPIPTKTTRDPISHHSTHCKPIDSAIGSPEAPASTKSTDSDSQTHPGARPSTDSSFKAPTPLRNYREEPKLWEDWSHEGGKAGKAIADWKEKFVPLIHDVTKAMTIQERTEFFDQLTEDDEDRYLQPLACYYTVYPDHIPDRDLNEKQVNKIEDGTNDLPPRIAAAQKRVFARHFDGEWNWDPERPIITLEPDLGPRDEASPDEELGICQHCISQTRKGKAMKIVKPVMIPVRAIQRKLSKSVRVESQAGSSVASRETSDDEESSETSSGSKHSKPRDVTETGVGRRRPMSVPRRRRGKESGADR